MLRLHAELLGNSSLQTASSAVRLSAAAHSSKEKTLLEMGTRWLRYRMGFHGSPFPALHFSQTSDLYVVPALQSSHETQRPYLQFPSQQVAIQFHSIRIPCAEKSLGLKWHLTTEASGIVQRFDTMEEHLSFWSQETFGISVA